MAEIWGLAVAAVVGAGAAVYSANKQADATKAANQSLQKGVQTVPHIGPATLVDYQSINPSTQDAFQYANQQNQFQLGQALRGYNRIQPYFGQIQSQLGKNALQMSQGNLPSDVVASIGRAAASRGLANGFGQGANGGQGALGMLNLRNLGLTSLQVQQQGNELGLQLGQEAKSLSPQLFDPSSLFLNPGQVLSAQEFNANAQNQNAQFNSGINTNNVATQNAVLQLQAQNSLASADAQAKAFASAAQSIAGLAGTYGTIQAGGGFGGANGDVGGPVAYGYYGAGTGPGGTFSPANTDWQDHYV